MAAYLVSSNTINQLKEELDKIIQKQSFETFDASIIDINELINEISYTSLFSENRIIVVNNADYFSTQKSNQDTSSLEKYLEQDPENTTIIFTTTQKIDERKKITKLIKGKGRCIICPTLTIKEICRIIEQKFTQDGFQIDQESLYYLVNNSQNNYDLSLNEYQKIKIFYNEPSKIKKEDLKNIVSSPLENNNFKLVDAVIGREIKEAMKIYQDLKIQKVEPIIILNLLAREYRLMYLTTIMLKKHLTPFEITKKLGLQNWQVDKIINNSSDYKQNELKNILRELANIDFQIKKGQLNKHLALEVFILKNA